MQKTPELDTKVANFIAATALFTKLFRINCRGEMEIENSYVVKVGSAPSLKQYLVSRLLHQLG